MSAAAPTIVRHPLVTVIARPSYSEPSHLGVARHGESTEAERLVEFAGRVGFMSQQNAAERPTREYLESVLARGREDALDHATFSLLLEGVSRTVVHELRRLRAEFAFAERTARSLDQDDLAFVVPPAVLGDAALEQAWIARVSAAHADYRAVVDGVMARYGWVDDKLLRRRIARDAAQAVLPGSVECKLVMTGNTRAWRLMLAQCASADADFEMRRLALVVLGLLRREAPALFSDFAVYQATDRGDAAKTVANTA